MKVIYIAGPYTAPDSWEREQNIRAAEHLSVHIMRWTWVSLAVIVPHTMGRFWHGAVSEANAIAMGLELVRRSDAIMLAPGWFRSAGTKAEIDLCLSLDKPAFGDIHALADWLRGKPVHVEDGISYTVP